MDIDYAFYKFTEHRYLGIASGHEIRCTKGLFRVCAPTMQEAECEARHYFMQYYEDGEYDLAYPGQRYGYQKRRSLHWHSRLGGVFDMRPPIYYHIRLDYAIKAYLTGRIKYITRDYGGIKRTSVLFEIAYVKSRLFRKSLDEVTRWVSAEELEEIPTETCQIYTCSNQKGGYHE